MKPNKATFVWLLLFTVLFNISTALSPPSEDYAEYPINYGVANPPSYVNPALQTRYDRYRILDNTLEYVLYWTIDLPNKQAKIAISAKTQGNNRVSLC